MTKIEDMSETQRQAWTTLIVDSFVFLYFLKNITTDWSIDTLSSGRLTELFLGVIITTIILHAVIASVFAARKRAEDEDIKDERDIEIERKGASYGFGFLAVFLNIIVGHIVLENSINGLENVTAGYTGLFTFTNPSHLVFALLSAAFIGDIIKNATMILAYRNE